MEKIEVLAPAGNMDNLYAAIIAGCDAVYLGGYMFGARSYAGNFSNEELIEAIKLCHHYNVKVYVTTNTLVYENEVDTFLNYIDFLHQNNVDAIIIQDLGMLDLVRQTFPNLEVHASTQMHIHNLEGVKFCEKMGIKRVVLARETTIEEIENIRNNTNLDLEIFVHGALCISYSGQCLMSSLIGNRSGNRGSCAGSCRQKYNLIKDSKRLNTNEYLLSTKDLNTLEYIDKLIKMGVNSLKIEGRMKSPEYVYLVVSLYKEAVNSYYEKGKIEIDYEKLLDLKKTFNREFTKGFMFHDENYNIVNSYRPNHQGIKIGKVINYNKDIVSIKLTESLRNGDGIRILNNKEDVGSIVTYISKDGKQVEEAYSGDLVKIKIKGPINKDNIVIKTTDFLVSKKISSILKTTKRLVDVSIDIKVSLDKPITMTITDGKYTITKSTESKTTTPINNPISKEDIVKQLSKLGNTIFNPKEINIEYNDEVFIPIKELNNLRRSACEELLLMKEYKTSYQKNSYNRIVKDNPHTKNISMYIENQSYLDSIKDYANTIYMDNPINKEIIKKIPRVLTSHPDYNEPLLVGEIGSVNKYKKIDTDFSLNITNSYAVALLDNLGVNKITLSYELNESQIKDLVNAYHKRYNKHPNLEVIVFGKEEVMISKYNLLKDYNIRDNAYLEDRFHNLYPIKIKDNLMYIYNFKIRNIESNLFDLGINSIRYNIVDDESFVKFKSFIKK